MPSLGADMKEGILVRWLVDVGDEIKRGDIIAVIETYKGAIDMEAYYNGILGEILIPPLTSVPVGTVLARLNVAETIVAKPQSPAAAQPSRGRKSMPGTHVFPSLASGILASPLARKTAAERQLDLSLLKGSGPNNAVLFRDLPSEMASPGEGGLEPMRIAIAAAMSHSKQQIPHFYLSLDIDISRTQQWLKQENSNKSPEEQVLLLALLLKATAAALCKYPALNGTYQENHFIQGDGIHIGNVISLRTGGIVVPAIHHVDQLSVPDTMKALRDITERSRHGHLRSSELSDATITVTSMGERGADMVWGVIYPPQVAILGFGRPHKVPRVTENKVVIADMLTVCLSADHRVIDGIQGAKFLNNLDKHLQQPELL